MKHGFLAKFFSAVAVKRLSAVEADTSRSNQHEFNGTAALKRIFGDDDRIRIPARFLWLGDEQEGIAEQGFLSWYDARRAHPIRSEYRLYFPTTAVSGLAQEGDTLFIAACTDGSALNVITGKDSTIQNQLLWLFGIDDQPELKFTTQDFDIGNGGGLDFTARFILDELGIEMEEPQAQTLDDLLEPFGLEFPKTAVFSEFARNSAPRVSPHDDPDGTLLTWMDHEEALFRRQERRVIDQRLSGGFLSDEGTDVDGFLSFSLSVQNRRKSRAGYALGNHIDALLQLHSLRYKREATTEKRNGPDFLFPGEAEYHDPAYATAKLTMLGAKTTCKDRWRQVLTEANRIPAKHLLTLEPGISEMQTAEMQREKLQLVVPKRIHESYKPAQQFWLMDVAGFLDLVRKREA